MVPRISQLLAASDGSPRHGMTHRGRAGVRAPKLVFGGLFFVLAAVVILQTGTVLAAHPGNGPESYGQRPVAQSEEEMNDFTALTKAVTTPETFLPMAEEFLKKYPESRLRGILYRDMVAVYGKMKKPDLAFEVGAKALTEKADNISVMAQLADLSSSLAITGDKAFSEKGIGYASQAVALLEAGKRPYEYTEDQWQAMRPHRMAQVYVSLGIMQWSATKCDDAVNTLVKALQLDARDPYAQLLLAKAENGLIQTLSKANATEKDSMARKKTAERIVSLQEQMLLSYARALVFSEDPKYAWLHPSVEAEVAYIYKTMPEQVVNSQTLNAQTLTNRVRTEQNAEPTSKE